MDDRRRYFRIEDTVSFTVSAIEPAELQIKINSFWDEKKTQIAHHQFNHPIEQHIADFQVIEKKMPELARYLRVLQAQIDNLTAKAFSNSHDTQKVNLSGKGMAYLSNKKLTLGDMVELYLELLSSGLTISVLAEVVSVFPTSEQGFEEYRIALDFTHIYESDQALIVKRINAQQLKDIVAKRATTDE